MEKILTFGKSFVDEYGRERIFNGINICDKGTFNGKSRDYMFPWSDGRIGKLKSCGFNLIRLCVTWDAIEPEKGKYNEIYLAGIKKILDECERNGIYVYLDMHQDLFSGFGNGPGDGAPYWACLTENHKYRLPKIVWDESYFIDKAVHKAFDNFWQNKPLYDGEPIQDHYIKLWQMLAARFGNHGALFGFDLMNEPFMGSDGGKIFRILVRSLISTTFRDKRISKKELFSRAFKKGEQIRILDLYTSDVLADIVSNAAALGQKFDEQYYSPFIARTAAAIREITPNGILMIENNYFSNLGIPCAAKPIEFNGKREPNQAFSPHAYDFMVDTPLYKYANNGRVGGIFAQRKKEQDERFEMPVLVGEWGGNSVGTEWLTHVEYLLSIFDSNRWSNTYWDYHDDIFDSPLMSVLCRPCPIAVTGHIKEYRHDRRQNTFTVTYEQDECCSEPTRIYLHKKPEKIECSGQYEFECYPDGNGVLSVTTQPGTNTVKVKFVGNGFSFTEAHS